MSTTAVAAAPRIIVVAEETEYDAVRGDREQARICRQLGLA